MFNTWLMLRAVWPGSRMGLLGNVVFKGRMAERAGRVIGSIADRMAKDPSRENARALFMAHPHLIEGMPDNIKRQLGIGGYEFKKAGPLPVASLAWLTQRTGINIPGLDSARRTGLVYGASKEGGTGQRIGKGVASRLKLNIGRIGPTRYRDRPIIKEELQRAQDIKRGQEENKKTRKKRRLPKKLQPR